MISQLHRCQRGLRKGSRASGDYHSRQDHAEKCARTCRGRDSPHDNRLPPHELSITSDRRTSYSLYGQDVYPLRSLSTCHVTA